MKPAHLILTLQSDGYEARGIIDGGPQEFLNMTTELCAALLRKGANGTITVSVYNRLTLASTEIP